MIVRSILLTFLSVAFGYNLDEDYPIVHSHRGIIGNESLKQDDSYFGYTVLLYAERFNKTAWLIIGAPRGNYSRSFEKTSSYLNEPGVVYRCAIEGTCQEIKPATIGDIDSYILRMKILIKKEHGWFGGSMAIDDLNGYLTVCAPRTVVSIYPQSPSQYFDTMQGMCYSGSVSSQGLNTDGRDLLVYDFSKRFWYNPLHGFSVHFPSTRKTNEEAKEFHRVVGRPGHDLYGSMEILNSEKRISVSLSTNDDLTKFGYSVTSGYFFGDELLYVGGAPGWQYVGQVTVLNPWKNMLVVAELHGSDIGEFFGASLASCDMNNDGLDDLVIGAPYWSQDRGKVYAYLGTREGHFEAVAFLHGDAEEGHFGYALACGDLDADGFDDVIVGAPWEEQGVIYVYNGKAEMSNDEKLEVSQRISALEESAFHSDQKIERFGFSISKPVDIDDNGYPDIAIGAYKSGHAVVLRSRPIVKTVITIRTTPEILQRDAESFAVEICAEYHGYNMTSTPEFMITLIADERYQRVKETYLELKSAPFGEPCVFSNLTILDNVQDFIEPIIIVAKHDFLENTSGTFCKTCPMECRNSKSRIAQVLQLFDTGCGNDTVCNSKITATAKFHGTRENDTWVIGSDDISLQMDLENHGEPAYLTTIMFTLPEGIIMRSILPSCQEDIVENSLIIACDVGNPLAEGEQKSIKLDLDMRPLIHDWSHGDELMFLATINTRSRNHGTVNVTKVLNLVSEVSLSLNGESTDDSYYLSTVNDASNSTNLSFQHNYQVYKLGATPIEDARLIIRVPVSMESSESLVHVYKPRLYISGEAYECSSENTLLWDTQSVEVQDEDVFNDFDSDTLNQTEEIGFLRRKRNIYRNKDGIGDDDLLTREEQSFYENGDFEMSEIKSDPTRSKRIDVTYFNCSSPGVNCSSIVCDLSALRTLQDVGQMFVKFLLDIKKFKDNFAEEKKILKFSTDARVEIIKPAERLPIDRARSNMEIVTFFHFSEIQKLQLWIILVSVSVGLLLLLIFASILAMLGFFKRNGKRELTELQSNEITEDEANGATILSKIEDT